MSKFSRREFVYMMAILGAAPVLQTLIQEW